MSNNNDWNGFYDIKGSFTHIDETILEIKGFIPQNASQFKLSSFFSEYLIVLITRTIEGSIENIIYKNYVMKYGEDENVFEKLKKLNTPNWENIKKFFKELLGEELDGSIIEQEWIRDLNQLVNIRQLIVHSDQDLQRPNLIGLDDIEKKYKNIKDMVKYLCSKYYELGCT